MEIHGFPMFSSSKFHQPPAPEDAIAWTCRVPRGAEFEGRDLPWRGVLGSVVMDLSINLSIYLSVYHYLSIDTYTYNII